MGIPHKRDAPMACPTFDPLTDTPILVSRFPGRYHPEREKITLKVQRFFLDRWPWTSEDAKLKYTKIDLEGLGAVCFPTSREYFFEIGTVVMTFFFLYDDMLEEMGTAEAMESVTRLTKIISGDKTVTAMTLIEKLAYELFEHILSIGDPALREMGRLFVSYTITFLNAAGSKEGKLRSLSRGFSEFLEYRRPEGGGLLMFGDTFWARGLIMPTWLSTDEEFQNLLYVATGHVAMVNDLFSYRVERKRLESAQGGLMYNSVSFLSQKYGMTPADAMEELKKYILAEEEQYTVVLERLKSHHCYSPEHLRVIEEFSSALGDGMGGNIVWSKTCGRYNDI